MWQSRVAPYSGSTISIPVNNSDITVVLPHPHSLPGAITQPLSEQYWHSPCHSLTAAGNQENTQHHLVAIYSPPHRPRRQHLPRRQSPKPPPMLFGSPQGADLRGESPSPSPLCRPHPISATNDIVIVQATILLCIPSSKAASTTSISFDAIHHLENSNHNNLDIFKANTRRPSSDPTWLPLQTRSPSRRRNSPSSTLLNDQKLLIK